MTLVSYWDDTLNPCLSIVTTATHCEGTDLAFENHRFLPVVVVRAVMVSNIGLCNR